MKTFRKPAPRQAQIMRLLDAAWPMPMTVEAIALEVIISQGRAANILNTMRMQGRVVHLGNYVYSSGEQGACHFVTYGSARASAMPPELPQSPSPPLPSSDRQKLPCAHHVVTE